MDWEPIISIEDWEKVQRIRMSKRREGVTGHNRGKGKKQAKDKWCRNTLENRKHSFRIANGLSGEGFCDMGSIPEWKLAYQLKNIMEYLSMLLKAIHSQESKESAREKAAQMAEKLKEMKLSATAKKLQDGIEETLTYMDFPTQHWNCIRTNNTIERLNWGSK